MPRKRTGHVERKGDRWIARVGREYLGSWGTEEEAREAITHALDRDKHRNKDGFAVRGEAYMVREELLARERRGNARMFQKEWSLWDRHIRTSAIYKMPVKQIRREHVQDLLDKIVGSPAIRVMPQAGGKLVKVPSGKLIGRKTAHKVRSRLTSFFDTCMELTGNPAARCKLKNTRKVKVRQDGDRKPHLHTDEIERLFALPDLTDAHRAVYALGIYAGLRVDEIYGLRWENIVRLDGDEPELHVRHSWDSATKTEMSQREVPMLPQLVAALRGYRASLPTPPIVGVVFPGAEGKVRSVSTHHGRWYDKRYTNESGKSVVRLGYRTLAGIRDHIEFRHLRHSCATHLLAGTFTNGHEWPIEKVSELLGHEDVATTIKHYASRGSERLHREVRNGLRLVGPKTQPKNQP
jgi:integrase